MPPVPEIKNISSYYKKKIIQKLTMHELDHEQFITLILILRMTFALIEINKMLRFTAGRYEIGIDFQYNPFLAPTGALAVQG